MGYDLLMYIYLRSSYGRIPAYIPTKWAATGRITAYITPSGPTLSGLTLSGLTPSGPTLSGPTPYRTGFKYLYGSCIIFHNDTYIKFVVDNDCMNAVPGEREQCFVHSTEYSVLGTLDIYILHMDTFITGNRQIVTLVKRKQRFKRSPSP
jgi:hypothetical protein